MKKAGRLKGGSLELYTKFKNLHEVRNIFLIFVLTIIPYYPSLTGDFVFDDAESIVNNPIVNGQESILKIFIRDFWGKHHIQSSHSHKSYRPVTTFTFWLNRKIHGSSTFGYHFVNIGLHFAVTLVLYKLLQRIENILDTNYDVALHVSGFFAIHPIHTEAVANITGRAELLMTLFSLIALFCHLKNDLKNSIFFAILSIFSKEQGIMTMPIMIAFDFLTKRRSSPFLAAIFGALSFLRLCINGFESAKFSHLDNPAAFVESKLFKGINMVYIWLYHVFLLFFPTHLCFDYSMGCISVIESLKDPRAFSPVLLIIAIIGMVKFHGVCRLSTFACLLGILSFIPSSNLFFTVGFTVAERVLYLPSVGFCILCGVAYKTILKKFEKIEMIAMCILLLASSKSFTRSEEWQNEFKLYSSGLHVCPMNAKIHYNLGKTLGDSGMIKFAEKNYWNAIKLNPSYEQALNNLGNLLEKSGDSKTAEGLLARAVNLRPNFAVAWMNLGITQMNLKKFEESEKSLKNSLKLRPESAHCLFNLGILYQKTNRELLAMSSWINATYIEPKHSQSWTNLFVVLDQMKMCSEVIHLAPEALKHVPMESSVQMQIGTCYAQNNEFELAEIHLLKAIDIQQNSSVYHANLGVLYQRMSRDNEAANEYRIALMLNSQNLLAKSNLLKVEQHENKTLSN